ncbi:hypothetical protein JCM16358_07560 [Halanaerocella petrolearia]
MRQGRTVNNFNLTEKIEVNQQIGFEVLAGKYEGEYPTQIADIINDKKFIVNIPFSEGQPIQVAINSRVDIKVRDRGGIYVIPARIVGKDFDATRLLELVVYDKVTKIQEREFFRLDIYQKTDYRVVISDSEEVEDLLTDFKEERIEEISDLPDFKEEARIRDISAGGAKFLANKKLEEGQLIELKVDFLEASFNSLFAKVVRVVRENEEEYEVGVKFINCKRQRRDELTKWLFSKQRELRQKGLI